jgi:uncharacterized metal-binding protein YceD (DUF177 family)
MNMIPEQVKEEALCSLIFKTDGISAKGVSQCLEVNARECAAIVKVLDLLSLDSMRMEFKLHRYGRRNRFKLKAHLLADVTQSCVVTLEPIECKIDEHFDIEFWPTEEVARLEFEAEEEGMAVPLEGPEPIEDGSIDVGQIAYEHFAAALDPYPRKSEVNFDWKDPRTDQNSETDDKPFAELARLKGLKSASSD